MSTVGHTMALGGTKADEDVEGSVKPGERIKQAEREIEEHIQEVLRGLVTDLGMVPTRIDIDMLEPTSFQPPGASRMTLVGPVRLRF